MQHKILFMVGSKRWKMEKCNKIYEQHTHGEDNEYLNNYIFSQKNGLLLVCTTCYNMENFNKKIGCMDMKMNCLTIKIGGGSCSTILMTYQVPRERGMKY